jgi:hypothetical protein
MTHLSTVQAGAEPLFLLQGAPVTGGSMSRDILQNGNVAVFFGTRPEQVVEMVRHRRPA